METCEEFTTGDGFTDAVARFARVHNEKHGALSAPLGSRWVRIRPPRPEEVVEAKGSPRLAKFCHVGTVVTVRENFAPMRSIGVACAGDQLLLTLEYLFGTFVRLGDDVYWTRPSQPPSAG